MGSLRNLKGDRYGRLTVVSRAENISKKTRWLCKCNCGNEVTVYSGNLIAGRTKSCGCWKGGVMTDLKPCPFCGGVCSERTDDNGFYYIECDNCNAPVYCNSRNYDNLAHEAFAEGNNAVGEWLIKKGMKPG